jgi:hypothetical protein
MGLLLEQKLQKPTVMPIRESDIPSELHSVYEDRPFRSCTRCGESLAEVPEGYQLFKLFLRGEVLCEYALCHHCHAGLLADFSAESRRHLADYHAQRMALNLGSRRCAVCGHDRMDDGEYSLTAACEGTKMRHVLMVCGPCRRDMQSLLSRETRDVWDRFVSENFAGAPPDLATPVSPLELMPA